MTDVVVSIPWYRRRDYPRLLEIMDDAGNLPVTYDAWHTTAERGERELKAAGSVVVRAPITPDEFVIWCRELGLKPGADARTHFAGFFASQQEAKKR
jgi:hypothetical protein